MSTHSTAEEIAALRANWRRSQQLTIFSSIVSIAGSTAGQTGQRLADISAGPPSQAGRNEHRADRYRAGTGNNLRPVVSLATGPDFFQEEERGPLGRPVALSVLRLTVVGLNATSGPQTGLTDYRIGGVNSLWFRD